MAITYEKVHHMIERQWKAEQDMLDAFASGTYTLQQPLVQLNPYYICPLTAMVMFRTEQAIAVTVTVKGKTGGADVRHRFPAEKEHILPVYGLYADYNNTVEIQTENGETVSINICTDPLIADVYPAASIDTTAEYMGENMMFLTASMDCKSAAYDYAGDVRWYTNVFLNFDMKRLANGHILVGTERLLKMPYYTSGLYEMALSGKIYREYVSNMGGYHHDQQEMPDGNLLMCTSDYDGATVEDVVVLLDRQTGAVLKKWDVKNVLPQYPIGGSGDQDRKDWFHNNAVWYDEKNHSLILSGRHQDAVISLDYDTGALQWILGDSTGWPEEYQKYFFHPTGNTEDFEWQYEQHGSMVLPDGDIMLFDNGRYRSKEPEHYLKNSENYSRGVRYRLNTDRMEIQQIWQYGKERGGEFFSPYICNVDYYGENHYMVHSGGVGYMDEAVCEGFACVDMLNPGDHVYRLDSVTCELCNDKPVYEMHVPANFYRARKMPLYASEEVFEPGKGIVLNALTETRADGMAVRAKMMTEKVPDGYGISILEEDDRIRVTGLFEEGAFSQLILSRKEEQKRYTIPTKSDNFTAMCVGSFQKADSREVDLFISKTGLKGTYGIQLLVEEEDEFRMYDTGVTMNA